VHFKYGTKIADNKATNGMLILVLFLQFAILVMIHKEKLARIEKVEGK